MPNAPELYKQGRRGAPRYRQPHTPKGYTVGTVQRTVHRQSNMDPRTSPENLPPRVIAMIVVLSLLGGLAHFVNRLRRDQLRGHWALELTGDCLYSLAAGFSAWYLAHALHLGEYAAAGLAIVAGHLGARLIWLLQNALLDRLAGYIAGMQRDNLDKGK